MRTNRWSLTPVTELHAWHLAVTFPQLRITSGHRTPGRNRQVGGTPSSLHLSGRAVDFVAPRAYLEAVLDYARTLDPVEALVHDRGTGLHLHLAW